MSVCRVPNSIKEMDDASINLLKLKIDSTNIILDELQSRFENQLKLQEKLMNEQNEVMDNQDKILDGFQTKLISMEEETKFSDHMSGLYDRLLDDHDQIAQKINLRLEGLEIFDNDSPEVVMDYIKAEVKRLKLSIENEEFDRTQRVGPIYQKDGKKQQCVLLKMRCCLGRNEIYTNRHRFNFEVYPDLTSKRQNILHFAKTKILLELPVSNAIDSVFVDLDCKLQLKTKCGRSLGFSSETEFVSLLSRVAEGDCMSGTCNCNDVDGKAK